MHMIVAPDTAAELARNLVRMPGLTRSALGSRPPADEARTIEDLLARSRGMPGRASLSGDTLRWLGGLEAQLPGRFWVHRDAAARRAAGLLGCLGFARGDRIYLGDVPAEHRETVLRHELVHLAQIAAGSRGGAVASEACVEWEADAISRLTVASPVQYGADPDRIYPIFWFIVIGIGLYVLLRPGVANAPGPGDRLFRSPSMGQILLESLAIFAVPGGAMRLGGSIGLGFLGSTAFAGAASAVSMRVAGDVGQGGVSPALMYLTDATTGAVIGFVVPGGFRLIGQAGTFAFTELATYGMVQSDIAVTRALAEEAAARPLDAAIAKAILATRGMAGHVSEWYLERRGIIILYRGQNAFTSQILSPLAQSESVAASEALVARMRSLGMSYEEIAGYTARWHTQEIPPFLTLPELWGEPLGSVGIPTTRIPGIAANFGDEGVIYVLRVPASSAITPMGWQGLQLENEYVILNQVPSGSVVKAIPASQVAPLMVDHAGRLVPGF
jgi:hypothetical protein